VRVKLPSVVLATLLLLPTFAHAEERALFLQKVYLSFCLKRFDDYAALRGEMIERGLPRLAAEQAAPFLQGQEGDAWPVPYAGQFGQFVLTLPAGDNLCAVMARRADPESTERWFVTLAETAPAPLKARQVLDETRQSPLNGEVRTRAWRWAAPAAPQQLQLTLTTAQNPDAAIQAMVSLALIPAEPLER